MKTMNLTDYHVYRGGALPTLQAPVGFDYVLAGNGLFLRAESRFVYVLKKLAPVRVAGLPEINESFCWKLPLMPAWVLLTIHKEAERYPTTETFYRVKWVDGEYKIYAPSQHGERASLRYYVEDQENVVLEIHTHPKMEAFFSDEDNADEQGFRIYGVLASPFGEYNEALFRLGIYGYHFPIDCSEFVKLGGVELLKMGGPLDDH
jgi:PRTRC genetic system protein A